MQEVQGGEVELSRGSVEREEGRKGELRGDLRRGGANGGGAGRSQQRGTRNSAHGLRSDEEKVGDVSEHRGKGLGESGEREGEVWSTGSSRRRRGGSAAILDERAVDCDAWR